MFKLLGTIFFCLACLQLNAADYYWIGGSGNWSDVNHWATTSGGSTNPSIVPSSLDDVYFDGNSGLVTGVTVNMPLTGHAYCRNMIWSGITYQSNPSNRPRFQNNQTTPFLYISGNLELSGSVAYGIQHMSFEGSSAATIKMNGAGRVPSTGWYNPITINKPGGSLTLSDLLPSTLAVTGVALTAGTLDIAGQSQTFESFSSVGSQLRTVEMTGANLTINGGWSFTGTNKSINNANSLLTVGVLSTDGLYYPDVNITTASSSSFSIIYTSFGRLTFTNPLASNGSVRIQYNNTIRRLEFKGDGLIRNSDNVIDTLIGAGGKQLNIWGTNTINKLFQINTLPCSGLATLVGGDLAILNFATGAVLDLNNIYIDMVKATGSGAPFAVIGAEGDTSVGFNYTLPSTGNTLFWVGGSGNWNEKAHWSATSGGVGGFCVPIMTDDVIFDANSGFTPAGKTVTTNTTTFCKDMTWAAGIPNSPTFNESVTFQMQIWGNVVMNSSVTMNADPIFRGSDSNTLTTNGSSLGNFSFTIQKVPPLGGITLTDDLINNNTNIRLSTGAFLLPGRTMEINNFVSSTGQRKIDITNATITTQQGWTLNGVGRTWIGNAANSFITTYNGLNIDGLTYPKIHVYGLANNSVYNATIGELIFQNPSPSSLARIHTGNTIGNLEFKGSGGLLYGGNTITNLTLAPSRNYYTAGTNNINGVFSFSSPPCTGLGELRGLNENTATLTFGSSASTSLANIYLQNISAAGAITPISLSGADAGGNSGFNISSGTAGSRYWIGGSGDWNDASHWSLTSGGVGGACIPTVQDDVFFNVASFGGTGNIVTTTSGNAYCRNMSWAGATNAPVFNESGSFNMEIWGNLTMNPAVTMNAYVNFMGANNSTLTTNGSSLGNFDFLIDKPDGNLSFTLVDNLNNTTTDITIKRGSFDARNITLNVLSFSHGGYSYPTSVDISNSIINGNWYYNTTSSKVLIASGSVITSPRIGINGGAYNIIDISGGNGALMSINNITAPTITFSNVDPASTVTIGGSNTIGTLEFKSKGFITGSNTVNTLIFSPGRIYTLTANTNTTVTGSLYGSGTPCNSTEINSSSTTTSATITKASGAVNLDYIRLRRVNATGGATFTAMEHSQDLGSVPVTGWQIAPYSPSAPIYGLGPDTTLPASAFPYVLRTTGFFGSPLSQYTWSNASTLDSLVANGAGTYGVTVGFPDGCSISDNIKLSLAIPLPVTLNSFTVLEENCHPVLSWNIANSINLDHFEIQRSLTAKEFKKVSTLQSTQALGGYKFIDMDILGDGMFYYRLKLVDANGIFTFSQVRSLRISCAERATVPAVYPTITDGKVFVELPNSSSRIVVSLSDAQGQQVFYSADPASSKNQYDFSGLASGVYNLQVKTQEGIIYNYKIVRR